ncbi:hypothetical protein HAX54_009047, partial [Datura stramonium]|nr:hypothetical protein [Datura stramonium]
MGDMVTRVIICASKKISLLVLLIRDREEGTMFMKGWGTMINAFTKSKVCGLSM